MTVIRDLDVPPVEGDARPLDSANTGRLFVTILAASAVVLSGLNLAVSVYQWRSTQELRAIDERLQTLADFEKRLKANLDGVNTGVQGRLANLEKIMQRGSVVAQDEFRRSASVSREVTSPPSRFLDGDVLQSDFGIETATDVPGETDPTAEQAVREPALASQAPPPVSKVGSSYQRIELADGKVYYRRVQ